MDYAAGALSVVQFFFAVVIGLYFLNLLRSQQGSRVAIDRESRKEMEHLRTLRQISLSEPLAERTRPRTLAEVVGQEDGVRALKAALCGPNPQHVLIYGPPGVGKTAAARLVLEEARRDPRSPFRPDAAFVEVDATTVRFDERAIADVLIGSVHDPIYQGAGPMGVAGIPQPKPGAVTRAHGGVLFLDEIGELHPLQMNRLLKVLEDRKVSLESAYYSSEDPNIPRHIQDIFENGLPADFRLVGATTKTPEDLPPAIRSRCVEIFFRPLTTEEVRRIAAEALSRAGVAADPEALDLLARYAENGREAVNMVQLVAGLAQTEGRATVRRRDVAWVVEAGQHQPRLEPRVPRTPAVGVANGLAVAGPNLGVLIQVEAVARPAARQGSVTVTGAVHEEEVFGRGRTLRRRSLVLGSVENVLTLLEHRLGLPVRRHHIHVDFPGYAPLDGPSAGVTVACAVYSAITGRPVDNTVAMTGELSILGEVRPVGGVAAKVAAARRAGATTVLLPRANLDADGVGGPVRLVPVDTLEDVLRHAVLGRELGRRRGGTSASRPEALPFQGAD